MFRKIIVISSILLLAIAIIGCSENVVEPKQVEQTPIIQEVTREVIKEVQAAPIIQTKLDNTPRIAVISAFGAELALLLENAEIEKTYDLGGRNYYVGTIAGNDVVMFLSGVSMVNAALHTQIAIDQFNVERIVFSGIAGGVNDALNIGDVAVPAQWAHHLENYLVRETEPEVFTPPMWFTPEYANFGMMFPSSVEVTSINGAADEEAQMFWFPVDTEMLTVAYKLENFDLTQCTPDNTCLTSDPKVKVGGNGVSGQSFVDNAEYRKYVWETFSADALDMETSSVAQVAYVNQVPYIAFRSLSDLAGGGEGENEIGTFFGVAADNSANLVMAFLHAWSTGELPEIPTQEEVVTETAVETDIPPVTFGMVLVGPKNDHGWSQAHYEGGLYVERNLPESKMIVFESLNPADKPEATLESIVDEMIAQGASLIITTSDEFEEDTVGVAEKYPEVVFINISGDDVLTGEAPPNEGNLMGKMPDMKAIAGCSAALTTQNGKLGYLGPLINYETRRLAASAYLGARYCYENYRNLNPDDLEFTVTWIGFWFNIPGVTLDPSEVTNSFLDSGVDVVLSGIDTTEGIDVTGQRAANGENVWAVPYDFEGACDSAPEICLGVPYFNWGPAYLATAESVGSGSWIQSWDWNPPYWKDLSDNTKTPVGWITGPGLTSDPINHLTDFIAGLATGNINVWTGPINLQDGTAYIEGGQIALEDQIWYLPQLLEGMLGPSN